MAKIEDAMLQAMTDFIRKNLGLIEDEKAKTAYQKVVDSMALGYDQAGKDEEKRAWLNFVLCDQCYRFGYYLWAHGKMTEPIEKELRIFEMPEEALKEARVFMDEVKKEQDRIVKESMEIDSRRNEIDVFKSILAGDSLEQAQQRMEEFEARQQKVLGTQDVKA